MVLGLAAFGANSEALSLTLTAALSFLLAIVVLTEPDPKRRSERHTIPAWWQRRALYSLAGLFTLYWLFTLSTGFFRAETLPQAQFWAGVAPARAALDLSALTIALLNLGGLGAAFLIAFVIASDDSKALRLLDFCLYACVALLGLTLILYWRDPSAIWGLEKTTGAGRFSAAFSSPNIAGTFCGVLTLLTLSRTVSHWQKDRHKTLRMVRWSLMTALSLAGLILSQSRGAVLSFVPIVLLLTALIAVALRTPRKPLGTADAASQMPRSLPVSVRLGLSALGLAVLFTFVVFNPSSPLLTRLSQSERSFEDRQVIFAAHMSSLKSSPVIGYGPGSFDALNRTAQTHENIRALMPVRALHNTYLHTLQEVGIVGFVLISAVIGTAILVQIHGLFVRRRHTLELAGLVCASLFVLLHCSVEYSLQEPAFALFWAVLLGIATALAGNSATKAVPPKQHKGRAIPA